MARVEMSLEDLRRILRECAGAEASDGGGDVLDGDVLDVSFEALGYESLALLETVGRIEREFGISLDDSTANAGGSPRTLIEAVNAELTADAA